MNALGLNELVITLNELDTIEVILETTNSLSTKADMLNIAKKIKPDSIIYKTSHSKIFQEKQELRSDNIMGKEMF